MKNKMGLLTIIIIGISALIILYLIIRSAVKSSQDIPKGKPIYKLTRKQLRKRKYGRTY